MEISEKIKKFLEEEVKPLLGFHGGDVEFASFNDGILKIKLRGACFGCMMSELTLEGIKKHIIGLSVEFLLNYAKIKHYGDYN